MGRFSETAMGHFLVAAQLRPSRFSRFLWYCRCPRSEWASRFILKAKEDPISETRFPCHDCDATIATGSMLTELITGKRLQKCSSLSQEELLNALGCLPTDKQHCAGFAIQALQQALEEGRLRKIREDL